MNPLFPPALRPVFALSICAAALWMGAGCGRQKTIANSETKQGNVSKAASASGGNAEAADSLKPIQDRPGSAGQDKGAAGNRAGRLRAGQLREGAQAGLSLAGEAERRDAVLQAVRRWADADFEGALSWVQTLSDSPAKHAALVELGTRLARENFPRALALGGELATDETRADYLRHIAQAWAADGGGGIRSAAEWARGIGDDTLRGKVLAVVAVEMAQGSPAEAAALVGASMPPGPEQDAAAVTIASRWAAVDPGAAAAWAVTQFPDGSARDNLLHAILAHWLPSAGSGASDWISSLPPGSARESAVNGYLAVWSDTDPAGALDWAAANGHDAQIALLARRWLAAQPEAARAWVSRAPLSDDARYHLIYDDPQQPPAPPR